MTRWPHLFFLLPLFLSGCATSRDCSVVPKSLSANFGSQESYRSFAKIERNKSRISQDEVIRRSSEALNRADATHAAKLYFGQARAEAYARSGQKLRAVQAYQALSRLPGLAADRRAYFEQLASPEIKSLEANAAARSSEIKDAQPLVRIPPQVPTQFLNGDNSGHCAVIFDVDASGKVVNAKTDYCTNESLKQPSIKSLQRWKYAPKTVDGNPVLQTGFRSKINFSLQDECGDHLPE